MRPVLGPRDDGQSKERIAQKTEEGVQSGNAPKHVFAYKAIALMWDLNYYNNQ